MSAAALRAQLLAFGSLISWAADLLFSLPDPPFSEPTSGLDARAAAIVMRAIRAVADSNRTVVTTIHQPSMEIFEAFDMLVLMQRGGRLTYFGPLGAESSELISYLQAVPGVEPIRPGINPATWLLEVTGGSMTTLFKSSGQDFPSLYQESTLRRAHESRMDSLLAAPGQELTVSGKYATSLSTQRYWLIRKFFKLYWHSPQVGGVGCCCLAPPHASVLN